MALPFITGRERGELLALAMDHLNTDTQLEAAWAAVKVGNEKGAELLARACTEPATFVVASQYLRELDRADAIPAECNNPDFVAEAQARSWLAHPNEFGRQPDKLVLFDSRTLFWPPSNADCLVHLFHYFYSPKEAGKSVESGVVMTGGQTPFSLFSTTNIEMPAEHVYALHCCWELKWCKDPRAPAEHSIAEGLKLLGLSSA